MNFNPIYWNTACLIVNSGSLEDNSEEEIVDIYAPEAQDLSEGVQFIDLPDKSAKIRRTAATDYGKIAKAIGDIQAAGIKVSLANINKSSYGFAPDVDNNRILFGLKGMLNVGDDVVAAIIANRPYSSPKDFLNKGRDAYGCSVDLSVNGTKSVCKEGGFGILSWSSSTQAQGKLTISNFRAISTSNNPKSMMVRLRKADN